MRQLRRVAVSNLQFRRRGYASTREVDLSQAPHQRSVLEGGSNRGLATTIICSFGGWLPDGRYRPSMITPHTQRQLSAHDSRLQAAAVLKAASRRQIPQCHGHYAGKGHADDDVAQGSVRKQQRCSQNARGCERASQYHTSPAGAPAHSGRRLEVSQSSTGCYREVDCITGTVETDGVTGVAAARGPGASTKSGYPGAPISGKSRPASSTSAGTRLPMSTSTILKNT